VIILLRLANQGFTNLALKSAWAQPVTTLMGAVGIACLIKILINFDSKPLAVLFNESNNPTLFAFSGLIFTGIASLFIIPALKFQIRKVYAAILFLLYISFVILAILTELDVIFKDNIADNNHWIQ